MKALMVILLLLLACLAQVTVAPLFPISGAQADLPLITMAVLAVYAGPTTVMFGLPLAALFLGFGSSREPGLLVLGYLPLLPLGLVLEEWRVPLNRYARTLVAGGVTGLWLRSVLAAGAMVSGAPLAIGALIGQVLIPGLIFDLALLTLAYVPFRFVGWSGRSLSLRREGYWGSY